MKSQSVISSSDWGGRRSPPFVFTEQGIAMLSSVLNSDRAIKVNIGIMRTFVKMRILLDENKVLRAQIEALESKYDKQFAAVFKVIKSLIDKPESDRKAIGYKSKKSS